MTSLNLDCWRLILDQLEPETRTRTLYSCLLVSKSFFHLSSQVLYRRPHEVHEGQQKFSPFSTLRLANLLNLCSGFTTPSPPTTFNASALKRRLKVLPILSKTTNEAASSASSTTTERITTSAPLGDTIYNYVLPASAINQALTAPTTINYYNLVMEYPAQVVVRRDVARCYDYLDCYAKTIPILCIGAQEFDLILPLVSKFQTLHTINIKSYTLTVSPSSPMEETLNQDHLDNILKFIRLHRQEFPGLLSTLETYSLMKEWTNSAVVQEAMGGMVKQEVFVRHQVDPDLSGLVVSRLKYLLLNSFSRGEDSLVEKKLMDLLKKCRALETLELRGSRDTKWSFNLLLDEVMTVPSSNQNAIAIQGEFGYRQEQQQNLGSVSKSSSISTSMVQQYKYPPNLKHLIVWGDPTLTVQAMEVFKDSLESVEIRWNHRYDITHIFGWEYSLMMPKLKSIIVDRLNFHIENLSSCPVLETLVLKQARAHDRINLVQRDIWSRTILPITIRKLELFKNSAVGFDILGLKELINLEYLHLMDHFMWTHHFAMIEISTEKGWWFPKLEQVILCGRFALQVQGQILWVAPRLKHLSLNLWFNMEAGLLDTDTFLFPSSELDFESLALNDNRTRWPWEMPITSAVVLSKDESRVSFPNLKSLKLMSFQVPKFRTAKAFGKVFFCPRRVPPNNNNDNRDSFLFPDLEQLEFFHRGPRDYLQPCVLQAMKNLSKLESVRYRGGYPYLTRFDSLANWLQEVPREVLGKRHSGYRNRPPAPKTTTLNRRNRNATRCVVDFDVLPIRYQLNPSPVGKIKMVGKKVWRKIFQPRWDWTDHDDSP